MEQKTELLYLETTILNQLEWKVEIRNNKISTTTYWEAWPPHDIVTLPVTLEYSLFADAKEMYCNKKFPSNQTGITLSLTISGKLIRSQFPQWSRWNVNLGKTEIYRISEANFHALLRGDKAERKRIMSECKIYSEDSNDGASTNWEFDIQSIINCLVYVLPASIGSQIKKG